MKRNSRSGFTLMEMLIVVAIIAIMVSISIPTFTKQLEKSREATDLANVRGAYAQVLADTLISDDPESVECEVPLHQKIDDFQSVEAPDIAGIKPDNTAQWVGSPQAGGACLVYYDNEKGVVLYWDGGSYGRPAYMFQGQAVAGYSWEGNGNKATTGRSDRLRSSGLFQLEKGKTYQVRFRWPDDLTEEEKKLLAGRKLSIGTLVFPDSKGNGSAKGIHDSGWSTGFGVGSTMTSSEITASGAENYLGVNVKIVDSNGKDHNFSANTEENKALRSIVERMLQNAEIVEVKK